MRKRECFSVVSSFILTFGLALAAGLLAACAAGESYLLSPGLGEVRDPRVAVLPFDNWSTDLAAPEMLREMAAERLSSRGWLPLPAGETDGKLRGLGVTDGGQLPSVAPAELGRALGADLLCYGTVEDFTFQNVGFVIRRSVKLKLKLVSASSGETLFEASGRGRDVKVYLSSDEAKVAFLEAAAAKLLQNMLKSPLRREAEAAVSGAFGRLPRR